MEKIHSLSNRGTFFLPEYSEDQTVDTVFFHMQLIRLMDLGFDGILNIAAKITVSWTDNRLRWDENMPDCAMSKMAMQDYSITFTVNVIQHLNKLLQLQKQL